MPTIQSKQNPGSRIEVGDSVIRAAAASDTSTVKDRLGAFQSTHRKYVTAESRVRRAEEALRKQQSRVAELDVEQNAALEALASSLVGDGLPRSAPFKPLGFDTVSAIKEQSYKKQAATMRKLADAVAKHKAVSKKTLAASKSADKCARATLAAIEPIEELQKNHRDAIADREVLAQPWENAFAALKRGARAAEDDGAKGLYTVLFVRVNVASRRSANNATNGSSTKSASTKGRRGEPSPQPAA